MTIINEQRERLFLIMADCAGAIWNRKPTPEYQSRIVRLLWLTCAHESDRFRARRQYGFPPANRNIYGAFGIGQTEIVSIRDSIQYVNRRGNPLMGNVIDYLETYYSAVYLPNGTTNSELLPILELIETPEGDPYAIMLARLHYLKFRPAIPESIQHMGEYAKRFYNTEAGKATPENYISAFNATYPFLERR